MFWTDDKKKYNGVYVIVSNANVSLEKKKNASIRQSKASIINQSSILNQGSNRITEHRLNIWIAIWELTHAWNWF